MAFPETYWITSLVDGDFDYYDEANGEKIAQAMLEHKQCVEVTSIHATRVVLNVKNITTHMYSTLETRTSNREWNRHVIAENKEWERLNATFDE